MPENVLPWETPNQEYASNLATPAVIMVDASNGASDYGKIPPHSILFHRSFLPSSLTRLFFFLPSFYITSSFFFFLSFFLSYLILFSFFPPFPPATTKPLSIPVPYRQQVRRTGGVWVRQIVRSAPAQQREGRVDQTDHVHSGSWVARF